MPTTRPNQKITFAEMRSAGVRGIPAVRYRAAVHLPGLRQEGRRRPDIYDGAAAVRLVLCQGKKQKDGQQTSGPEN
jgi:hypothetical protein